MIYFFLPVELGAAPVDDKDENDGRLIKEDKIRDACRLQVYRDKMESRFIAQTISYYTSESQNFLEHNPVHEYIRKVSSVDGCSFHFIAYLYIIYFIYILFYDGLFIGSIKAK